MPDPAPERIYSSGGIAALIVIGLLLLIPSGLCSGALGVMAIWASITQPGNTGDAISTLPMVVIVGGPFIIGGGAMVITGIRRARANRRNPHEPQ